ncbi:MAG: DUF1987 domain-containing protein [Bacteroidales bacterium]|jgi:hypothetical protein|nr:DUF1987 domain-containing protein [Bacteroidales bacterium]
MQLVRKIQTKSSPEILLDPEGLIRLKGRSILENAAEFYEPMLEWVDEYVKSPAELTCTDIELEYFNSATAKFLITLIQRLSMVTFSNARLKVNWYYEDGDDDIFERGEYLESVLEIDFNFIKVRSC